MRAQLRAPRATNARTVVLALVSTVCTGAVALTPLAGAAAAPPPWFQEAQPFIRVLRQDDGAVRPRVGLAEVLLRNGEEGKAVKLLREALDRLPGGETAEASVRDDGSVVATDVDPLSHEGVELAVRAAFALGNALADAHHDAEAADAFRDALRRSGGSSGEARVNLATVLLALSDRAAGGRDAALLAEAEAALEVLLQHGVAGGGGSGDGVGEAAVLSLLGQLHHRAGEAERAVERFLRALAAAGAPDAETMEHLAVAVASAEVDLEHAGVAAALSDAALRWLGGAAALRDPHALALWAMAAEVHDINAARRRVRKRRNRECVLRVVADYRGIDGHGSTPVTVVPLAGDVAGDAPAPSSSSTPEEPLVFAARVANGMVSGADAVLHTKCRLFLCAHGGAQTVSDADFSAAAVRRLGGRVTLVNADQHSGGNFFHFMTEVLPRVVLAAGDALVGDIPDAPSTLLLVPSGGGFIADALELVGLRRPVPVSEALEAADSAVLLGPGHLRAWTVVSRAEGDSLAAPAVWTVDWRRSERGDARPLAEVVAAAADATAAVAAGEADVTRPSTVGDNDAALDGAPASSFSERFLAPRGALVKAREELLEGVDRARGGQPSHAGAAVRRVVWISRSPNATRAVRNERELLDALRALASELNAHASDGTPPLDVQQLGPGALPLVDAIELVRDAAVVVGVHGAGLTNAMFAPRGAALVEVALAEAVYGSYYRHLASALGLRYAAVRGQVAPRGFYGSLDVDVGAVVGAVRAALHGGGKEAS